jgi:heme-degrading monooxygenase HmoA
MLHVHVAVITADPRVRGDLIGRVQSEVRPAVESQPGNLGMSLHTSPEGDVALLESFWASGDDMRAGQAVVAPGLRELAGLARRTVTERYEVPVFEVEGLLGTGEGVRRTPMDVEPSQAEDLVAWYGDTAVPWLSDTDGFRSALLYVDWASGHLVSETVWRDTQALAASRSTAEAIQTAAVEETGCVIGSVAEYRLVFSSARPS